MKFAAIFVLALIFFPKEAYAYLNPGHGSYFLQIILGIIFGGLISVKIFWSSIKKYINKIHSRLFKNPKD